MLGDFVILLFDREGASHTEMHAKPTPLRKAKEHLLTMSGKFGKGLPIQLFPELRLVFFPIDSCLLIREHFLHFFSQAFFPKA